MKKSLIFTIGHSTRSIDEFVELLQVYEVQTVADVRSIPKSRNNPQFDSEILRESLKRKRIRYKHIKKLGGLRHAKRDSINLGWRNSSFRGFADYMATPEFAKALEVLTKIASLRRTAIMCAEAVPWRCHRSLIADALTKNGWIVRDIMSKKSVSRHRLTPFLKTKSGRLFYPGTGNMIKYLFKRPEILFVGINPHFGSYERGVRSSNTKLFGTILCS